MSLSSVYLGLTCAPIFQQFLNLYNRTALHHFYLSLPLCSACLTCSSTTWCSSAYRSLPVSDSVSLSPPTPAVGDQPPSCQMMLRAALPLSSLPVQSSLSSSLPLPHIHACVELTELFYSKTSTSALFFLSAALPADVSPLFVLHLHLQSFLLICL